MLDLSNIAGVILAGGQSSRMGQNKALLNFKCRPLIEHMRATLEATGLKTIYISGSVPGYDYVADDIEFSGPAQAMISFMKKFPAYRGYLFVPVDMPLLTPECLINLLGYSKGAYYQNFPLPSFIPSRIISCADFSVFNLLQQMNIQHIPLEEISLPFMKNANTPKEWMEILQST